MSDLKLSAQERKFASEFVTTLSLHKAYEFAYSIRNLTPRQVYTRAMVIMRKPAVVNHIRDLRTQLSASALFDIQQIVNELVMIATADINEIVQYRHGACRHCHGVNFTKQYDTDAELAYAQAWCIDNNERMPSLPLYNPLLDPHPKCPHCHGDGIHYTWVADTRYLSPQAKRVYAGMKIGKDGQIEVKTRDQHAAVQMLMRIYGVYNPQALIAPPKLAHDTAVPLPQAQQAAVPQSPREASDFYQKFMQAQHGRTH